MAARGVIQRHLGELHCGFNIYSHKAFKQSNKILNGVLKANEHNGDESAVSHKDAVSDGDWAKIMEHFSDVETTQDRLFDKVCFSCVLSKFIVCFVYARAYTCLATLDFVRCVDDALSSFLPSWT